MPAALRASELCAAHGVPLSPSQAEQRIRSDLAPTVSTSEKDRPAHWRSVLAHTARGPGAADRTALLVALDGWPTGRLRDAVMRRFGDIPDLASSTLDLFSGRSLDPAGVLGFVAGELGESDDDMRALGARAAGVEDTVRGLLDRADGALVTEETAAVAAEVTGIGSADVRQALEAYAALAGSNGWAQVCVSVWLALPEVAQVKTFQHCYQQVGIYRALGMFAGVDDLTVASQLAPFTAGHIVAFAHAHGVRLRFPTP